MKLNSMLKKRERENSWLLELKAGRICVHLHVPKTLADEIRPVK